MIFVTVGLSHFQFDRLIIKMDDIASKIDEEVIMQIGSSSYEPINSEYFRFTSREKMNELYDNCRVSVTHGGTGAIINLIKRNFKPVVVPRLANYNEAFDNHQIDTVNELSNQDLVVMINNLNELNEILTKKVNQNFFLTGHNDYLKKDLISNIKSYINSLE